MLYSMNSACKSYENYEDGTCAIFDELGHKIVGFDGELLEIGPCFYLNKGDVLFDIVFEDGNYELTPHIGECPLE